MIVSCNSTTSYSTLQSGLLKVAILGLPFCVSLVILGSRERGQSLFMLFQEFFIILFNITFVCRIILQSSCSFNISAIWHWQLTLGATQYDYVLWLHI